VIAYAERGWLTIELRPGDNTPWHKGWPETATADVDRIRYMRDERPDAHIGRAMGWQANGRYHVGLDEDKPGLLAQLAADHGQALTDAWRQTTRRGMHHVYALARHHEHLDDLALKNKTGIYRDSI
jgi:hypothetical protein